MLILNSPDIEKCIQPLELINAVKKAVLLFETDDFYMPNRSHIDYKENTLLMMPAFSKTAFGTKLVSVFPENKKQSLPPIFGTMLLNDANNGKPIALLNGSTLTAHRTGALGGLAAKYIAATTTKILGIVGAGVQSLHQAYYIYNTLNISKIYIFDLSDYQIKKWKQQILDLGFKGEIVKSRSTTDLVQKSELIVTATTSEKPVFDIPQEELKGKKILAFGSYKPSMRELPETLFRLKPKVFIDTDYAIVESGDLVSPLEKNHITKDEIFTLGKLISGKIKISDKDTVVFKSVGMALFDLVVSKHLYQTASEKNIGTKVDF